MQCWSDENEVDQVCAGDNIKLKLKGIDEASISPGFVVCSQDSVCRVGKLFDAEVLILEHNSIIAPGYSCVLHIHAAIEDVTVRVSL
jgi:peptide chain release factor subunit 3